MSPGAASCQCQPPTRQVHRQIVVPSHQDLHRTAIYGPLPRYHCPASDITHPAQMNTINVLSGHENSCEWFLRHADPRTLLCTCIVMDFISNIVSYRAFLLELIEFPCNCSWWCCGHGTSAAWSLCCHVACQQERVPLLPRQVPLPQRLPQVLLCATSNP